VADHLGVLLSSFQRVTFAGLTGEARRLFVHDGRGVNAIFPRPALLFRTL